jgi:hypothetical protein
VREVCPQRAEARIAFQPRPRLVTAAGVEIPLSERFTSGAKRALKGKTGPKRGLSNPCGRRLARAFVIFCIGYFIVCA